MSRRKPSLNKDRACGSAGVACIVHVRYASWFRSAHHLHRALLRCRTHFATAFNRKLKKWNLLTVYMPPFLPLQTMLETNLESWNLGCCLLHSFLFNSYLLDYLIDCLIIIIGCMVKIIYVKMIKNRSEVLNLIIRINLRICFDSFFGYNVDLVFIIFRIIKFWNWKVW